MISAAVTGSAWAGPALDDAQPAPAPSEPEASSASTETKVDYGVGLRFRSVHVPQGLLELFVDRAAGGVSNVGVGVELTRRRGNVELQLGLEFENLTVTEGVWINKGENVAAGDEADFILGPEHAPNGEELGWFTIEFTFLNHAEINKYLSVRYGGGAGLGILTGGLYRYDMICNGATNANPEPGCVPSAFNGNGSYSLGSQTAVKYELPPVFPVVNAIIGMQIKPIEKLVINVETGLRTVPFFGITTAYFF